MLRNAVKDHWTREQLPIGSFIHIAGMKVTYGANESSIINPDEVLKLFEAGEISRERFLQMLTIKSTEAKNALGADQVADFTVTVAGTKADIRMEKLPVEQADEEFVMAASKIKKRQILRRKFGGSSKAETTAKSVKGARPRRAIKTRQSK